VSLTPITHAIYLLRQGNPNPATLELVEIIDSQMQTLVRFVNELLDLARIRRGQIEIRPERLDFVTLVRSAVQGLQLFIEEERQHELSLVLPNAAMYVHGDSSRLRQVVINLVENAAKYTEPGGRLAVTLEQRDDHAVLRVRDTGIGIAPENLERIFEPFTQSHQPLAGPSSGLGIGLTVVRRILELHSGHIVVASGGPGQGSEFVVSLPVAPIGADESAVIEPSENVGSRRRQRLRRVMIVDDHAEMRASLARLARAWGHEVALAADGASALSLAEAFQPECAILDLSMPGMNGIELARRLRQRFPPQRLYLIALTGYADADLRDGCLAAGFDAYLVKPGDIRELERLLGGEHTDFDAAQH
jgi:CheY-like chemotaxis protein